MTEVDPCFLAWVHLLEKLEKDKEKKEKDSNNK